VERLRLKVDGAGWTELTVLDESVERGEKVAVSVQRTELGVWFTSVDDQVRAGWKSPPAATALGYGGTVVVTFEIARDGAIREVVVAHSNVPVELEQAALGAIPRKVAAPPRGFAPLKVQYSFRYANVTSDASTPSAG
jgi:TonB family protein